MAESTLETQIDCFLEQFKRSASKAMEERAISRSRSSYLDAESPVRTKCAQTAIKTIRITTKMGLYDGYYTFTRNIRMAAVDSAEKEASEVLHTLLSVERIEKQEENGENQSPSSHSFQSNPTGGTDGQEADSQIQWHTPVSISHSLFSTIDPNNHFSQAMDDQQVIWEGHAIVDPEANINTIYTGHPVEESEAGEESPKRQTGKQKTTPKNTKKKVPVKKKKKANEANGSNDPTKLEESAAQVKDRFKRGCECQDESCFRGLNPESVYKHRLNIAELTKSEHDMYLMGVTMACLANPDTTVRHKERRRLRAQYVYQGRRVCLDAFLYLENCTHYQLKRIRKHVMTHGVAPRVHGNYGKKPHNTFSLDIYRHATEFLKQYLEQHTGERDIVNTKQPIQLPWDVTRKNLHDAYKEYGQILEPGIKLMGYSTFRHFMKEQFPHVKFCKVEPKSCNHQTTAQQPQIQQQNQQIQTVERVREQVPQVQKCVINNEVQQVIPLVVAPPNDNTATQHHQQTFLVTPVQQLLPNGNIVTPQNPTNHSATNTFSYQLTNTGYVINEQGNIVTTMANAQHHTPYAFEEPLTACEEFEMQNSVNLEPLGVNDVAELLQHQYAIISGGKSKEGCPIITFPDNNNFQLISDIDYQRLMLYLTSVPSLQDADLGFHLIIDRRTDRWNSVKTVLLKISVYFPGLIHVVYVLRPASFLQKALSEVSNKLFKDEFKFRMIVLSTAEELHKYINVKQLTTDLGGTLQYNHEEWIEQRVELEKFSAITQQVSNALDEFTKSIEETELPNNVDSTQQLLNKQTETYSDLKEEILSTAKHGENLLCTIKEKTMTSSSDGKFAQTSDTISNVFDVERLLVQLEETEKTFDEFWQQHSTKLRNCLELRRFEQDFRELQVNFDSYLKTVTEMTEVGETVNRVDTLIKETSTFEKLCNVDIERAEEVISSGQHLINIKNSCPLECVQPKCSELLRMRDLLLKRLSRRMETLIKCRELMEKVEKVGAVSHIADWISTSVAMIISPVNVNYDLDFSCGASVANQWCASGIDLLASQRIEQCSTSPDLAEKYLKEIQDFLISATEFSLNGPKDFKDTFQCATTPETKALVSQVLQRIEDVTLMCNKHITSLNKLATKPKRPVQTVIPEPAVPRQPQIGAPQPSRALLKKASTIPKMTSPLDNEHPNFVHDEKNVSPETDEVNRIKTGHVLTELFDTERVYVSELLSIINGYKLEANTEEMQHLIPPGTEEKFDVIFGNLEDIYQFHSEIFLKDLENCISSTDLVALCFVQKREKFFRLYSFYCQNISRSEHLRENSVELHQFFQACQQKLGHKLPLAAYLLKPVQRITKYQLLLKDLLRYSDEGKCCKELQQALECMLVVLKCVNDSMHQISITGFPVDLSQQGELLLQGSFSVWVENKKDLRLRLKPMRRHLFLYQKALLFCKPIAKSAENKATYQFKHYLKMSQIGLTESVKGDARKFEVWLQGRQEVHLIQAANLDQKNAWVNEIKRVLFNQLEEIKGEKIKQYAAITHKSLRQTTSWEKQKNAVPIAPIIDNHRALSCEAEPTSHVEEEGIECLETGNWSSDCSNSDDEDHPNTAIPRGHYIALADYCAVGNSEVNMRDGDIVELLKVGCAGWWYVKVIGNSVEGWAPAAYLENLHRKSSRSSSRSQDRLND